jgi:parallel beta-helix repeat protein
MQKAILLFLSYIWAVQGFALTLWISPTGNDANSGGNFTPLKTMKGAYDKVLSYYPSKVVCEAVTIYISGNIYLAESPNTLTTLTWDITGSNTYPISITSSGNSTNIVYRPLYDNVKSSYIIELLNANYISITNIQFSDATVGIYINSSDYCKIQQCKFISNIIATTGGAGTITLSRYPSTLDLPSYNDISYNYIIAQGFSTVTGYTGNSPGYTLYHGIYIAHAYQNTIQYNSVINPAGSGIHYWHSYSQNNAVYGNLIDICNDGTNKWGLILGYDPSEGDANTVFGNNNKNNYISYSDKDFYNNRGSYYSPDKSHGLVIDDNLLINNPNYSPNYFNHADQIGDRYGIDPYWVYYNSNLVQNRMVTGDFDGDGSKDDIAAMYDYGNGTSKIHVWLNKKHQVQDPLFFYYYVQDKSFQYEGTWWSSSGYDAAKVTSRLVSGDYNGDGKTDIAALYDYGTRNSSIQVWLSTGSSFSPSGYAATWWTASLSSYDATKVTGRFVSGDFDNNGKDDIAAMYDYGNGNSRIHTWLSKGNSFSPSGYADTWWTASPGSYNANNVSYRFVSGDFNGDNKNDLAAMYDYGSGNSSIHTWLSTGSSFSPSGYAGTWWTASSGSYNASMVINRFVCGDFNNDGKADIAAMYDYGSNNARLHSWTSNGGSFQPNGYANNWWISNANSYDVSKVTGRMFCGDFNNDSKVDIATMYDYSFNTSFYRTRYHVWECSGNSFDMQNGSLGYPWTDFSSNIGIICGGSQ